MPDAAPTGLMLRVRDPDSGREFDLIEYFSTSTKVGASFLELGLNTHYIDPVENREYEEIEIRGLQVLAQMDYEDPA